MNKSLERASLQERLTKCRELAQEYKSGEIAEMLREMDAELSDRIRKLDAAR
jgi:hypothetical protein